MSAEQRNEPVISNLRQLLNRKGSVAKVKLAAAGYSEQKIQDILCGSYLLTVKDVTLLAQALEIAPNALFNQCEKGSSTQEEKKAEKEASDTICM